MKSEIFDRSSPDPTVALWRAVVRQAILDAVASSTADHVWAARRWLLEQDEDFLEVCCHASLDPGAVRQRARYVAEVKEWRLPRDRVQWDREGRRRRLSATSRTGQPDQDQRRRQAVSALARTDNTT